MATDKMYNLAFQYKETKLWQKFHDGELFAVKLADGEIGYCCIMGMMGEHNALAIYAGEEGYQSYCVLRNLSVDNATLQKIEEWASSQSCLQCSFENRDMLSDEELEEVRCYAKANGKTLRGRNAFPQFTKYRLGRFPWPFDSALDEERICEGLSAAVALAKMLREYSKEDLGVISVDMNPKKIPMLSLDDGRWIIKYTTLPDPQIHYPEPKFTNDVIAARIKRKIKAGVWECGTLRIPHAVRDEDHEDAAPYYPLALVYVDLNNEWMQEPILSKEEEPQEMLNKFAKQLLDEKTAPRKIYCGDGRCFALLKDLCSRTGIQLEKTDKLEAINDVIEDIKGRFSDYEGVEPRLEEVEEMFEVLMQMSDNELWKLPEELLNVLYSLSELGALPTNLNKRIRKLFDRKQ